MLALLSGVLVIEASGCVWYMLRGVGVPIVEHLGDLCGSEASDNARVQSQEIATLA